MGGQRVWPGQGRGTDRCPSLSVASFSPGPKEDHCTVYNSQDSGGPVGCSGAGPPLAVG